jgi:hypothetical protein
MEVKNTSLSPIRRARLCKLQKGALDPQPQAIKFISCLPMVGDSLPVLRLPPPLKLVAIILLKVALNTINQIKSESFRLEGIKKIKK